MSSGEVSNVSIELLNKEMGRNKKDMERQHKKEMERLKKDIEQRHKKDMEGHKKDIERMHSRLMERMDLMEQVIQEQGKNSSMIFDEILVAQMVVLEESL